MLIIRTDKYLYQPESGVANAGRRHFYTIAPDAVCLFHRARRWLKIPSRFLPARFLEFQLPDIFKTTDITFKTRLCLIDRFD